MGSCHASTNGSCGGCWNSWPQAREHDDATITYGINLSALSLTQEGMLDWLKELLRAHSLPPRTVCVEITETAAISNLALARQFIAELKRAGLRLCP